MIQRFADWLVYGVFGMNADTHLGSAVNFFFYDSIKILILLFFISLAMGVVNAYFPIKNLWLLSKIGCNSLLHIGLFATNERHFDVRVTDG